MKKSLRVVSLVFVFAAAAATAVTPARVSRPVLRGMEQSLDDRISKLWPDNPLAVVGHTRAVYLEGFGAVFTAELNLASEGISLMHTSLTLQDKVAVQKKKIERVPLLKKALAEALADSAASLDPLPLNEQIVIEVILDRYSWEDGSGYPAEVIVQGTRQALLNMKHAGSGDASNPLLSAVKITEH